MYKKAEEVMERLRERGFSMTSSEFFKTTLFKLLDKYHIKENLTPEEYYKLLKLIIDDCAVTDMKEQGIDFFSDEDWKYK